MGIVALIGLAIRTCFGIISCIGWGKSLAFRMRNYHKVPCPVCAIMPNAVSLVGFHCDHKSFAGGRRLGEHMAKVELAQVFEKCDDHHKSFCHYNYQIVKLKSPL